MNTANHTTEKQPANPSRSIEDGECLHHAARALEEAEKRRSAQFHYIPPENDPLGR